MTFKPAAIEAGRFKATGSESTEPKLGGGLTAKATVIGKFKAGGKVSGAFEVKFVKASACSGKTTYTATAGGK
jgi:hypothetical protein